MATQESFFHDGGCLPKAPKPGKSETSREARRKAEGFKAGDQKRVLDFLRGRGPKGATDEEIQDALAMNPSTERPRRGELAALGVVEYSGEKRPTRSGCGARVWRAKGIL